MNIIKKTCFGFLLLFLLAGNSASVRANVLDTLEYSLEQKPRFFLNITTFNSYISKDFANFIGFRCGLNFNKRVRFGIGYFGLSGSTVISPLEITEGDAGYTTNGQLRFSYLALSADYTFYNHYPWQLSLMPFQVGIGQAKHDYIRRSDRQRVSTSSEAVLIYQPEITAQYNVFQWLGLSLSGGYRKTVYSPELLKENFNSPTFSLGVRLFVDELYKLVQPKQKPASGL